MGVRSSAAAVAAIAAAATTSTAAADAVATADAATADAVASAAAATADAVASAAAAAEAVATTSSSSSWDAVSGGASTVNSPQERSMPLRWLSSTHLPHWPKLTTMPPMEAGVWSELRVSWIGTLAATAVGRTVVYALGAIACAATSLNAAYVIGRPARPIK